MLGFLTGAGVFAIFSIIGLIMLIVGIIFVVKNIKGIVRKSQQGESIVANVIGIFGFGFMSLVSTIWFLCFAGGAIAFICVAISLF